MSNITYGTVTEVYSLGENSRVSYGIVAYSDANDGGTASVIASVHDVTSDEGTLNGLAALCNDLQFDPVHLCDVIDDFLAS